MLLGHPPFREASLRDPYFKRLARGSKDDYWKVYKAASVPPLFRDLFERIAEPDLAKRAGLREIHAHPWMAGPVHSPAELRAAMTGRMQGYVKLCWKIARGALKAKKLEQKREMCKEKGKTFVLDSAETRRRADIELLAEKQVKAANEKKDQGKDYNQTPNIPYR
eukprot:TRINITY_DN6999_c0_g1_i2.p2 TRINITY_DN6999_c0_g1~~TRINITY_DN6999_c0_g1_i2.p2  ORF type:complete len:165 (-),score=39.08 TRINITY_DN6999_c0_g1_i2:113-607(-)